MITSRAFVSIVGSSVIFLLKKLFYDRRIIGKAGKDDRRIIGKSIIMMIVESKVNDDHVTVGKNRKM